MNTPLTRRRCTLLLGGLTVSSALTGCSSLFSRKPETMTAAIPTQSTPDLIRIVYRTRTDRLNLAGAKLPHVSIAELRIDFPHDREKIDHCLAVVTTTPCSQNATPFPERGVSSTITSLFDGTASDGSAPPSQAWSADVPLWEVQAIIKSLDKLNFFRKHRTVLSADVFLSVETHKHAVGKKYRPVAELDAMLLRVAQEESATTSASYPQTARAELARLPAF